VIRLRRIGRVGFGTRRQRERRLDEAQRPHFRGERVALGSRATMVSEGLGGRGETAA
jgi:hypothetical protein